MKLIAFSPVTSLIWVAPFAGAWIEIAKGGKLLKVNKSLPSRERGLKLESQREQSVPEWSLPSRERGLKCPARNEAILDLCRSLRGSVD